MVFNVGKEKGLGNAGSKKLQDGPQRCFLSKEVGLKCFQVGYFVCDFLNLNIGLFSYAILSQVIC